MFLLKRITKPTVICCAQCKCVFLSIGVMNIGDRVNVLFNICPDCVRTKLPTLYLPIGRH
jgi:hypothetical protein